MKMLQQSGGAESCPPKIERPNVGESEGAYQGNGHSHYIRETNTVPRLTARRRWLFSLFGETAAAVVGAGLVALAWGWLHG